MGLNNWSRGELQNYLENRGFAVYDSEDTEVLREAVRLDRMCLAAEHAGTDTALLQAAMAGLTMEVGDDAK